jgi:hypothetical protein
MATHVLRNLRDESAAFDAPGAEVHARAELDAGINERDRVSELSHEVVRGTESDDRLE